MNTQLLQDILTLNVSLVTEGYDNSDAQVGEILDQVEKDVGQRKMEEATPWETEDIAYGREALRIGWLNLALASALRALQVSFLPLNEYMAGYHYSRRGPEAMSSSANHGSAFQTNVSMDMKKPG